MRTSVRIVLKSLCNVWWVLKVCCKHYCKNIRRTFHKDFNKDCFEVFCKELHEDTCQESYKDSWFWDEFLPGRKPSNHIGSKAVDGFFGQEPGVSPGTKKGFFRDVRWGADVPVLVAFISTNIIYTTCNTSHAGKSGSTSIAMSAIVATTQ